MILSDKRTLLWYVSHSVCILVSFRNCLDSCRRLKASLRRVSFVCWFCHWLAYQSAKEEWGMGFSNVTIDIFYLKWKMLLILVIPSFKEIMKNVECGYYKKQNLTKKSNAFLRSNDATAFNYEAPFSRYRQFHVTMSFFETFLYTSRFFLLYNFRGELMLSAWLHGWKSTLKKSHLDSRHFESRTFFSHTNKILLMYIDHGNVSFALYWWYRFPAPVLVFSPDYFRRDSLHFFTFCEAILPSKNKR